MEGLDSVTDVWGVKVERVEIKDVRLPIALQKAMATEAETVRESAARVIAADGEMRVASALKAAAAEIKQHPIAMQLRYLQAVSNIASGKESTVLFPVPIDLNTNVRMYYERLQGFRTMDCGHVEVKDTTSFTRDIDSIIKDNTDQRTHQTLTSTSFSDSHSEEEYGDPQSQVV